jgi:Tol biopolymer transport system component
VFVHDRKTGLTTRISVDSAGEEATGETFGSSEPSISDSGRFVAFSSFAGNLVPGDTNGTFDIFVHDRKTGVTTRVSVDSAGDESNGDSVTPSISAFGRFVAFRSFASNLVPDDTNGVSDIFVHDRQTGVTTRVSVDSAGNESNGVSDAPSISGDGRYVAFQSDATNLVPGDTNRVANIFVHDRKTGLTTRVSRDSAGGQPNGPSVAPSISANGRFVAFGSSATNLVPGDTNGVSDIFIYDRKTGITTRASVDSSGQEATGGTRFGIGSLGASISANGRRVAFTSFASNLVPEDANGTFDVFVHDRSPAAVEADCRFSRGVTTCTTTTQHVETSTHAEISGCMTFNGSQFVPGRRTRTFNDQTSVSETTTTLAHGRHGPVFDTSSSTTRGAVTSILVSDECAAI